jgi:hypothetical protein
VLEAARDRERLSDGGQIVPVLVERDHELRVALRQRQIDIRQMRARTRDGSGVTGGDVARELLRNRDLEGPVFLCGNRFTCGQSDNCRKRASRTGRRR